MKLPKLYIGTMTLLITYAIVSMFGIVWVTLDDNIEGTQIVTEMRAEVPPIFTYKDGGGKQTDLPNIKPISSSKDAQKAFDNLMWTGVKWLSSIVATISVFMIVWGGFSIIISVGDEGKIESGKNTIIYAIVGLVFSLLSYAIVQTTLKVPDILS